MDGRDVVGFIAFVSSVRIRRGSEGKGRYRERLHRSRIRKRRRKVEARYKAIFWIG
jgi:hypothetical protein